MRQNGPVQRSDPSVQVLYLAQGPQGCCRSPVQDARLLIHETDRSLHLLAMSSKPVIRKRITMLPSQLFQRHGPFVVQSPQQRLARGIMLCSSTSAGFIVLRSWLSVCIMMLCAGARLKSWTFRCFSDYAFPSSVPLRPVRFSSRRYMRHLGFLGSSRHAAQEGGKIPAKC